VAPGEEVEVEVRVLDPSGMPVDGGEVTLWAVDEAILAMANYRLPDPLGQLHSRSRAGTGRMHLADLVRWTLPPPDPGQLAGRFVWAEDGRAVARHVVRLRGTEIQVRTHRLGDFVLEDVPAGRHVVELWAEDDLVEERVVEVPAEGIDLGELLVTRAPRPIQGARERGEAAFPGTEALTVTALGTDADALPPAIELPPPPVLFRTAPQDLPPPPDAGPEALSLREDFTPLAAFEPGHRTDAEGRVRVRFRLPDTATRYRVMAIATRGASEFGGGESAVVAHREILVRPSFPRFLHPGDRAELTLLVQNAGEEDREVEVAARAQGLLLEGPGGFRLQVPAGDRREVRLAARAPEPGASRVEVVALSGAVATRRRLRSPWSPP